MSNAGLQDYFLEKFFSGRFGDKFYLTGGTALARFYFQHRESIGLDLFTQDQEVDFNEVNLEVEKIRRAFGWKKISQVVTDTFLQYVFEGRDGMNLKVDVIKDIPVHFGEIKLEGKIRVDAVENIGSNKVLAVFGRTEAKDFVDLYWIVTEAGLGFEELFELAKKKDLGLSEFYLASAVKQLEKVKELPKMLKPIDEKAMRRFYQELGKKLLLRVKPKK